MDIILTAVLTVIATIYILRYVLPDDWSQAIVTARNVPTWVTVIALVAIVLVIANIAVGIAPLFAYVRIGTWLWAVIIVAITVIALAWARRKFRW